MKPRLVGWLAMALVLAAAFTVGLSDDGGPRSDEDRARGIAETIGCPVCAGQSVAESDVTAARSIRSFIDEQVAAGLTDDEIRDEVDRRYPDNLLLTPGRSGLVGLVWVLPVVAVILAFAGLGYAFYRLRTGAGGDGRASSADRAVVERALADRHTDDRAPVDEGQG